MDELDILGENALIQQLPTNKPAAFVVRKQEKLPMRELMKQRSSSSAATQPEQRDPEPKPEISSDQTNKVPAQKEQQLAATRSTEPETKPATETKPLDCKLSDISIQLEDVTPHPSLPPVRLLDGEGCVSAVLHPTTNSPKPGVSVFVLQLTNTSKMQVIVRSGMLVS